MKKFILVALLAPLLVGCSPRQHMSISVAPSETPFTACREGKFLSPSTATLVAESPVEDHISQEVLAFDGRYRRDELLRPYGEGWQLAVRPHCVVSFRKRYVSYAEASVFPLGGLAVGRHYTLLIISRDRGGVVAVDVRSFRTRDSFRPRRVRLGSSVLVANTVVRLPTARSRPLLDPSRIKLRLEIWE